MIILGIKNLWKFSFLVNFSKAKTEQCDQKYWSFCDKIATLRVVSDRYFLEMIAQVSLNVATNDYFIDNETMKI